MCVYLRQKGKLYYCASLSNMSRVDIDTLNHNVFNWILSTQRFCNVEDIHSKLWIWQMYITHTHIPNRTTVINLYGHWMNEYDFVNISHISAYQILYIVCCTCIDILRLCTRHTHQITFTHWNSFRSFSFESESIQMPFSEQNLSIVLSTE